MAPTLLHDILDDRDRCSPERVAVRSGKVVWTYRQLRELSVAWASRLRERGVGRGDRVLVLGPHAAQTVPVLYAASRLGALYVVASDQLRPYVVEHVLADCRPALVLVTDAVAAEVIDALGDVPVHDLAEHPGAAAGQDPPSCLSVDPVSLIYTSGSTAMPKAVVSTHQQVLFVAEAIQSVLGYRTDDVVFCCLPLSFDYGLYQVYLACLAGAELVLGAPSDAGPPLLGQLRQHRVTVLPAVPTLATVLALLLARSGTPLASLRMMTNTGAALPGPVVAKLRALLPGLAVVPMFGLTECKRVSILTSDESAARPDSVGRPLPDTEVLIVDDDGRPVPSGQVGELVVRGAHVMCGYWRAPELTAATFRRDELGGVRLHTGDLCRLDAEGYLSYVGRRDELYKQRGVRISAVEVEAAALDVPGVELAAVLPPDAGRGAVLVVTGDVTAPDVLAHLAHRLEPVRLPAECRVIGMLPLHPNGKVDKRMLARTLDAEPEPVAL